MFFSTTLVRNAYFSHLSCISLVYVVRYSMLIFYTTLVRYAHSYQLNRILGTIISKLAELSELSEISELPELSMLSELSELKEPSELPLLAGSISMSLFRFPSPCLSRVPFYLA